LKSYIKLAFQISWMLSSYFKKQGTHECFRNHTQTRALRLNGDRIFDDSLSEICLKNTMILTKNLDECTSYNKSSNSFISSI